MGCASSNLLNNEDEFTNQLGSSALSHHIVSLTSTTYGLLNLDPPSPSSSSSPTTAVTATTPPTPPLRFTLGSIFPTPLCETKPRSESRPLETINSWELMSGLDNDSFRFSPIILKKPSSDKENSHPNLLATPMLRKKEKDPVLAPGPTLLDMFEKICPPNGENKVVIYTTTLRGIRKTFEACNAVRSAIEGIGVWVCERDVSMDRGFREELRELMRGREREKEETVPPRVFVKGRYIGGVEEVLRIVDEGWLGELLQGLPKKRAGDVCEGCGDVRFLPCFSCNGSCKTVLVVEGEEEQEEAKKQGRTSVVVRCADCNENGLVLCPICT